MVAWSRAFMSVSWKIRERCGLGFPLKSNQKGSNIETLTVALLFGGICPFFVGVTKRNGKNTILQGGPLKKHNHKKLAPSPPPPKQNKTRRGASDCLTFQIYQLNKGSTMLLASNPYAKFSVARSTKLALRPRIPNFSQAQRPLAPAP